MVREWYINRTIHMVLNSVHIRLLCVETQRRGQTVGDKTNESGRRLLVGGLIIYILGNRGGVYNHADIALFCAWGGDLVYLWDAIFKWLYLPFFTCCL